MDVTKGTKLSAVKTFQAPKEKVFEAWVNSDALKQWWKPMNNQLDQADNDLRTNGKLHYSFHNAASGDQINVIGEYAEVVRNEKLVFTWQWGTDEEDTEKENFKLTILFKDGEKSGCTVDVLQEDFDNDETLAIHRQAWEKAFNDLEKYLSQNSGGKNSSEELKATNTHGSAVPSGKNKEKDNDTINYNELPDQEKTKGYS
jgi:uncharacterized protein YndB with AHSA1/START domain